MRLEKKQEAELQARQGSAKRTMIQLGWLLFSFALAYFLITYLINQEFISYSTIYAQLSIPNSVPEWAVLLGMMFIFVVAAQFFLFIGFFFANPEGRRRLGDPTLQSRIKDPFDEQQDY